MKANIKYMGAALLAGLAFSSCSDDFLKEMKSYDQTTEDCYNYYSGAQGRLNDIYKYCQPDVNSDANWQFPSTGRADDLTKCTEEFTGLGGFVNDQIEYTSHTPNEVPDFGFKNTNNIRTMAYGRIRNVNDCIGGIENSTLPESQKRELLGQAHFWRAWCYYMLVKWYGGVPIVTTKQVPEAASFTQRSSTKDCIDFICSELDKANEYLAPYTTNGGWAKSDDYGRVTSGAALALKGRVLLMYASPLFNRSGDEKRWKDAYDCIKASIPVIKSCGNELQYQGDPGVNASNWASIFSRTGKANKEGILVTLYNDILKGSTPDYHFNNSWEDLIRPGNALGSGLNASATMVDLFPMKDGKRPASCTAYTKLDASAETYDPNAPFLNRDPRFYRTFAFPGVRWAFDGDPNTSALNNPYKGDSYVLWNYVWYEKEEARDDDYGENGSAYGSDNLGSGAKGIYVRKRSDDKDVSKEGARYKYSQETGFEQSANTWMEIRYAEVLLNLAEAACMTNNLTEAVEQLKLIRGRVGYTSTDNYGLPADLESDKAKCMAAILYERQIELAYEGKRFDDVRRWLLWDGGANFSQVQGAPEHWKVGATYGGNTCTWLGFTPLNGQRRENLFFRVKNDINNGLGGVNWLKNPDETPLKDPNNPDPLLKHLIAQNIERADYVLDLRKSGTDFENQLTKLAEFYNNYLVRRLRKGDGWDQATHNEYSMKFRPHYYFLGLGSAAQNNNKTDFDYVQQTIGWEDNLNGGANGTFDPLAE